MIFMILNFLGVISAANTIMFPSYKLYILFIIFENKHMDSEVPLKTTFTPSDLKLYVYGSKESDQFWLPSENSHSKKPFCLTDVEKFTFNKDDQEEQGQGKQQKQPIPNPLFNQTVYKVACGSIHSIVLTTDGRVFTFGCNDEGALGRKGIQRIPIQVQLQDPIDLIAAGDNHSLFANSVNGAIYFTGNYNYKRGEMMTTSIYQPTRIYAHQVNIHNKHKKIQKLSCGANHSTFLISGKVYCRGEPEASTTGRRISKRHKVQNSLTFNGVNISNVVDIQCGGYHTVVKQVKHGKIKYYSWGTNDHGQLGIGTFESQAYPTEIRKLRGKDVCQFAAGASFTLFLTAEGQLYGCGNNEDSNLGLGEDFEFNYSDNQSDCESQKNQKEEDKKPDNPQKMVQQPSVKPQQINPPGDKSADQMKDQVKNSATPVQNVAKQTDDHKEQQHEQFNKNYIKRITKIPFPEDVRITNIAAGQNFGFAWNKQNLYTWGLGYGYVLLNGEENDESKPFKVKNKIINNHTIHQLDAGNQHVLFTSYPETIDRNSVKIELKPSVWENLSIAKHGLKRRK